MKARNNTLDALKGVACIGVVFMHVQFPGTFGLVIVALSRMFVALFFGISGYYLYSKDPDIINIKIKRNVKKILKMTVFSFLFYFIWESFVRFVGGGLEKVIGWYRNDLFSWENLLKLIFLSYDPVVGHLWFLIALLEAYLIFWGINKCRLSHKMSLLSIMLMETHIIVMSIFNRIDMEDAMIFFRNVWFYGLPIFMLGYSLSKNKEKLDRKISERLLILLIPVGTLLVLAEYKLIGNLQVYNGSILLMIVFLMLAARFPDIRIPKKFIVFGYNYSSGVYIYHWMVIEIIIKLKEVIGIRSIWFLWIEPILVVIITVIGLIILSFLQRYLYCKKIKDKIENK